MKTLIHGQKREIEFLKDTFISNDCPLDVAYSVFAKYIPDKYRPDREKTQQKEMHKLLLSDKVDYSF